MRGSSALRRNEDAFSAGLREKRRDEGPYSRPQHLPAPVRIPGNLQIVPSTACGSSAPPPPPKEALATLWVGSLLPTVGDDDIFDAFAPYGFVSDVQISEQHSAAAGGMQAFVKYTSRSEATGALNASLNRQLLVRRKAVTCRWAKEDIVSVAQLRSAALNAAAVASPPPSFPQRLPQLPASVAGCNFTAPKLWLGNLPMGTTEDELRTVCRAHGCDLVDIIVHKKPSQYGQLSGFVRFKTQLETEIMLRAIKRGAIVIRGAVLKADWAKGTNM